MTVHWVVPFTLMAKIGGLGLRRLFALPTWKQFAKYWQYNLHNHFYACASGWAPGMVRMISLSPGSVIESVHTWTFHPHVSCQCHDVRYKIDYQHREGFNKTSQELRMLSSVTINCQVTKVVMIQVLNCQNCDQCLKFHKSPGLSFQLSKWQKQLSELWKLSPIVKNCQNCK